MQTMIETPPYLAQARAAGLIAGELAEIVDFIAANPRAGDLIVGTGGCRKLRWAKAGKGKSGGVRVISYFGGETLPVFLLAAFAKGQKDT